jgi:hypothetical protein
VIRALIRLLVPMAVVATMLAAPAASSQPTDAAQAADLSYFDPSNIISDAVFYDYWSMDGPAIQAFLNAKGAKCAAGEMPCIKNYTQNTAAMAGDALCGGYSAGTGESAATIITKVAVSCGISPRVLLVLLQKEQSLITRTTPTVPGHCALQRRVLRLRQPGLLRRAPVPELPQESAELRQAGREDLDDLVLPRHGECQQPQRLALR